MKIHINEYHSGGLRLEGQVYKGVSIQYCIEDGETRQRLVDRDFTSYEAAEAYIAGHFSQYERWAPPPPSNEELSDLVRILKFMEEEGQERWKYPDSASKRGIWAQLSYHLHQHSHSPEIDSRIRNVLASNPYDSPT